MFFIPFLKQVMEKNYQQTNKKCLLRTSTPDNGPSSSDSAAESRIGRKLRHAMLTLVRLFARLLTQFNRLASMVHAYTFKTVPYERFNIGCSCLLVVAAAATTHNVLQHKYVH